MMIAKTEVLLQKARLPRIDWEAPSFAGLDVTPDTKNGVEYRLFRVREVSEGQAASYRMAMANVLSSLCETGCSVVYMLDGKPEEIALYVGVSSSSREADLPEAAKTLQAAFEGNFLGARLDTISNDGADALLPSGKRVGLITGVPTFNEQEGGDGSDEFQGIERLVNSLVGETWQLVIVADPASDAEIRQTLDQIYDAATALSEFIKHSVQRGENTSEQSSSTAGTSNSKTTGSNEGSSHSTNEGMTKTTGSSRQSSSSFSSSSGGTSKSNAQTVGESHGTSTGTSESDTSGSNVSRTQGATKGESLALTSERTDKRAERLQKHLTETLIERYEQGRSKGMFRTAVYVSAETKATFNRLSRGVLSIYQGNQSSVSPLRVTPLELKIGKLKELLTIREQRCEPGILNTLQALTHSVPITAKDTLAGATWLNSSELALMVGLPSQELPGLKIRKSVDFALNTGNVNPDKKFINLGRVIQHGRPLLKSAVCLPVADLNKHIFITGVTGAGKTTTCMTLLLESGLPFMVIEPAKTEYRALYGDEKSTGEKIEYYALGRDDLTPFRLNPFELLHGQKNLAAHIATLNATMAAVFPMEAAMPYIVEEAIIKAYKAKGWDIHEGKNYDVDDPWAPASEAWPTFSDMIGELRGVIKSKNMGREFEEKYEGSLVARLTNLTLGVKGRMLNTRRSLDFSRLLNQRVVIELEELKDEQDKALFMGFIICRTAECMKQKHRVDPAFQHLTLIEEAHRLLSRPEPGDPGSKKMGVEMFSNLLAEVRKYGEGLIIADQIPNKLVVDVIKNTNTKIVHRLFAADDRNAIGDAMSLSDEQKDFLPLLQAGETIIYCGGWHAPVRVQVEQLKKTNSPEIEEEEIKRRGQVQLWDQRERLFPRLSADATIKAHDVLFDFVIDGRQMLNMLLRLLNPIDADPEKLQDKRLRIANSLKVTAFKWMKKLEIEEEYLGELLARLFSDCDPNTNVSYCDLKKTLPKVTKAALESLGCFDQLLNDGKDRDVRNTFSKTKFGKVDSI